jgi:hypothetical protein
MLPRFHLISQKNCRKNAIYPQITALFAEKDDPKTRFMKTANFLAENLSRQK